MSKTIIPENYQPALNLYDTQRAIGTVKRLFADTLCATLNLYRVSAPLFLEASTGLNDDLNGVERKVTFDIKDSGIEAQVVQSLAKWKRKALKDYDFRVGKGLYCDMNAIRRDEDLDNLHSIYVDQWDWEKVIRLEDRNEAYLKSVVRSIVSAVCATEMNLHAMFPQLQELPLHSPNVTFITTQELEDKYPDLTPKERENAFVKENGTAHHQKAINTRFLHSINNGQINFDCFIVYIRIIPSRIECTNNRICTFTNGSHFIKRGDIGFHHFQIFILYLYLFRMTNYCRNLETTIQCFIQKGRAHKAACPDKDYLFHFLHIPTKIRLLLLFVPKLATFFLYPEGWKGMLCGCSGVQFPQ